MQIDVLFIDLPEEVNLGTGLLPALLWFKMRRWYDDGHYYWVNGEPWIFYPTLLVASLMKSARNYSINKPKARFGAPPLHRPLGAVVQPYHGWMVGWMQQSFGAILSSVVEMPYQLSTWLIISLQFMATFNTIYRSQTSVSQCPAYLLPGHLSVCKTGSWLGSPLHSGELYVQEQQQPSTTGGITTVHLERGFDKYE